MTRRRVSARIGTFESLEDRVVLSRAANLAIINDVSNFYANSVSNLPPLVQAYTSAAAGSTAQSTAQSNLSTAITDDVNNLGQKLLNDLGPQYTVPIAYAVTGDLSGGIPNSSGSASPGSLLGSLLAIQAADAAFLDSPGGLEVFTNLSLVVVQAMANPGQSSFAYGSFGGFAGTYYNDVQPLAMQLAADQMAASTPPTPDQQSAIDADVAAIDAATVNDVNALGQSLVAPTTPGTTAPSEALVRQLITGSSSTTGVAFTAPPGTPAPFGTLLSTLQSLETDPLLLEDAGTITSLVSTFAYL